MATNAQLVLSQGFLLVGVSQWKAWLAECVGRGEGFNQHYGSRHGPCSSNPRGQPADRSPHRRLGAVWRCSARDGHHTGLTSPRRWFRLSELRDAGKSVDTQSFQGTTTDVDWLCWPRKSEGDGPMKLAHSSGPWRGSKHAQNHRCCANGLSKLGDSGGGPSLCGRPGVCLFLGVPPCAGWSRWEPPFGL